MQKHVVLPLCLCLKLTSCALGQFRDVADHDQFLEGVSHVTVLGPRSMAVSTTFALYLSTDSGLHWKGLYSTSQQSMKLSLKRCPGGSSDCVYFVISKNDEYMHSTGETLMKWSPLKGIETVSELPASVECRFVNDRVGAYVHGRHAFFTVNGGSTWNEGETLPSVDPPVGPKQPEFTHGRPTEEALFTVDWASPTEAVVVAGGAIAVYEVGPDGSARRRWRRNVTHDKSLQKLLAVGGGEIWVRAQLFPGNIVTAPQVCMFKVSDGSPIERPGEWPENSAMLLADGAVYVVDNTPPNRSVAKFELTNRAERLLAKAPVSDAIVSAALLPSGRVYIFEEYSGAQLDVWDGKAVVTTHFSSQIDNAIVRQDFLGSDRVPASLIADMGVWTLRAGMEASEHICDTADKQTGWSKVQQAKWIVEQCKIAVANHGAWNPPATMPATQPIGE